MSNTPTPPADTPRTNDAAWTVTVNSSDGRSDEVRVVDVEFAQGLERQLIACNRIFGFHLDAEELTKLAAWRKDHDKTCPFTHHQGAIGGRLAYLFAPTSLGVVAKVECECGAKVDLTDYDAW